MATRIYPRRRADRRTLLLAIALTAAAALFLILTAGIQRRFGETASVDVQLSPITDQRVCAATAVYLATAEDWAQRAATAQVALNQYRTRGPRDCSAELAGILEAGLDTNRWQASIDAVDAMNEGTYALPLACLRADTVIPLVTAGDGSPLVQPTGSARTQCVIGDLAFAETQP